MYENVQNYDNYDLPQDDRMGENDEGASEDAQVDTNADRMEDVLQGEATAENMADDGTGE